MARDSKQYAIWREQYRAFWGNGCCEVEIEAPLVRLVEQAAVKPLQAAITRAYPLAHPQYRNDYAEHVCSLVYGFSVCQLDEMH